VAWNSLYWDNHDQPRAVSRWVQAGEEHRVRAAKMLATCLHLMKGTPYVYQGEELGMTNFPFESVEQCDDIEAHDAYRMLTQDCGCSHEEAMAALCEICRDNARTPMQWDASEQAGFTTGEPWLAVNPNYTTINAALQVDDPDSVFSHYRRLIALRHESDLVVHGTFRLLLPQSEELFVYERELADERMLVACNFCDHEVPFDVPQGFEDARRVAANYDEPAEGVLRPFEGYALMVSA
jgi:oligo-1,6-glucosidase